MCPSATVYLTAAVHTHCEKYHTLDITTCLQKEIHHTIHLLLAITMYTMNDLQSHGMLAQSAISVLGLCALIVNATVSNMFFGCSMKFIEGSLKKKRVGPSCTSGSLMQCIQ